MQAQAIGKIPNFVSQNQPLHLAMQLSTVGPFLIVKTATGKVSSLKIKADSDESDGAYVAPGFQR